ncbi:WSC domain-containing protein [Cladophialophora immunda]|nr:WSC domain-containing protein [Cladophialophora immunda]
MFYRGSTSSTTSTSTSISTSTSASVTSSSTPTAALPTPWQYYGCYIDGTNGRILDIQQPDNSELTVQSCVSNCRGLGYGIAGVEYGVQCFCDDFTRYNASLASESDCNMVCAGDISENCGAGNRINIYSNATLQIYQPPAAQTSGLPGNWTYQGCLYDDAVNRTFPYQIEFQENNTAANCLNLCAEFGYGAGGMEYGEQCFCGDQANVIAMGNQFMPETDCNMPCSGNASQICGQGNRISFYNWTGAPLESWSFATGPAAGQYEFLIGGPLIPLITTVGLNNKIVYMEKFGTEPANNSTGTYELDLTLLDNYTAAWRPMHVKSDIFCSAGLTLPDKAGRQVNIGGWANDATYGIRLYTPDGSAGVWGVNDWQENVNELSLMAGRWYPTAMIMANGSILVVGGETGSNGPPVPSLEILPRPVGVTEPLYCDYLNRTDPYNLYPYLAVLPSGGVFIAYYNEARILDETTLQTSQVLPNIPGAVNTFLAGRSYPMEGTAMLLPQHAPYTDPLGIIICGGSTIGPEIALDNCVSIEPEVPNANWTIERMPSKRVISSMVALPDGTYLILNGGQQGFAGFGLATEPNHNAVLYDPTKPFHNRMTVMANTTIDRLYHSEAILLPDGRILVSGSDPEDVRFVQEYRNEVFIPPYLLNGVPQPKFTIVSNATDWTYSQEVTLEITAASADIKVSLLGAVSSTHGNSMGQRTIFPAVSCSGSTCTVTAPPNAHVCPAGWYMLYVLDNGTPSISQWVRIGGDPAELGNWPNLPDFYQPGM